MSLLNLLLGRDQTAEPAAKPAESGKKFPPPIPVVEDGGDVWVITIPGPINATREFERLPNGSMRVTVSKEPRTASLGHAERRRKVRRR